MRTRVLVIKHDTKGRDELKKKLMGKSDVEVCKWISDGAEGVAAIKRYNPDVVLLDLLLPNVDGVAILEEINAFFDEIIRQKLHFFKKYA